MGNEARKQAQDQRLTVGEVREDPWRVIAGIYEGVPLSRMLAYGEVAAAFFRQLEENEALRCRTLVLRGKAKLFSWWWTIAEPAKHVPPYDLLDVTPIHEPVKVHFSSLAHAAH